MQEYEIRITKQAVKDIRKLSPKIINKLKSMMINILSKTPYEGKNQVGDLKGKYSLRLNIYDRIVQSIDEENKIVFIKRAKTHYGEQAIISVRHPKLIKQYTKTFVNGKHFSPQ